MSDQIKYRKGAIAPYDGNSWAWVQERYPGEARVDMDYRRIKARVFTHGRILFFHWRIRSDDEAIAMLCEQVDELYDAATRQEQLLKERQERISVREKIMQDMDRDA